MKKEFLLGLISIFFASVSLQAFVTEGEEYAVFEENQFKGLADKNGNILIPAEYEELGWSSGETEPTENVLGFKKDGLWGLLNTRNERITEPVYASLNRYGASLIVASKKLPYNSTIVFGVINTRDKAEIGFNYVQLTVHGNLLIALRSENGRFVQGVLNSKGEALVALNCDEVEPLTPTLFVATKDNLKAVFDDNGNNLTGFNLDSLSRYDGSYFISHSQGKRGLISQDGKKVIVPQYKDIKVSEGKIEASRIAEWQMLDEKNEFLKSFFYDDVEPRSSGIYRVRIGNAEGLVDERDSVVTPFSNVEILEHFGHWISVKKDGKFGVLNAEGRIFLPAEFDSVRFENGMFLVKNKREGKRGWSMINQQGQYMNNLVYTSIQWIGDSYFKVQRDKYWGVINMRGEEKIYCKYDSIIQYTEGKLLVKFLGEDGILNMDGTWEVLPQKKDIEIVDPIRYLVRSPYGSFVAYYPETKDFTAEYFLYKKEHGFLEKTNDNKYGLLTEDGRRIIRPDYTFISELYEDSIYLAESETGYSFISKTGKVIIANDSRFQAHKGMSEEFIGVKIDDRWGFVDINGKLRIANQYENIGLYHEGLAPVKLLRRWGYIDKLERIVVQPAYDTVFSYQNGLCEVVKKGKFGLINSKGELVVDCEYDDMQRIKTGGYLIIKEGKIGLVSKTGRLMILPRFDAVTDLNNGFVVASRNGKCGLFSNDGVSIIPMMYDALKYDAYRNIYLAASAPEWIVLP